MVGQTIAHYKILEKIGQGGMGEVYLAEDTLLRRKIAIKFLPPHTNFDEETEQRFRREAQTAAALNHPNVVTIYQLAEHQDRYFIVMEYVEGKSLRDMIRKKELQLPQIINITLQICEGISRAHQAGIIHRDIKPENIMINREGMVKFLDFGLAKLRGGSKITRKDITLGTFQYMSPEQAQGRELDFRSDIFSIGVVLYEMLTGRCPFTGDYEYAVLYSIINEATRPLKTLKPDIPEAFQPVIDKLLQKSPEDRYPSVQELKTDLENIAAELRLFEPSSIGTRRISGTGISPESTNPVERKPRTIEELLEQRQKIDQLIASEFTKNITIMFSDVVGSTDYFSRRGDLEGRAMLQRYTGLMFPIIRQSGGKIIKTIGDGILASFVDPQNAARSAINMQLAIWQDNQKHLPEDRITIRIAMHFGKAVIDQSDVFGDVVNVASRVEKYAQSEEILISQALYEQIKDNAEFNFQFADYASFKGKKEQFALYRILWKDTGNVSPADSKPEAETASESQPSSGGYSITRSRGTVKLLKTYKLRIPEEIPRSATEAAFKNPYMNRVKIQNIGEFYGRKNEISKIYSRIGASRPQSISLVGERRIGKSSLLNFIYHPRNRQQYLGTPDQYLFIFIDFQEKRGIDVPDFFQTVFDCLLEEYGDGLVLEVKPDYEGFKNVVATFDQHNLKIILIFDEFEIITRNQNFDTEFYSYSRSIANNFNVAFIVSSGRNLQSLCHSREISDSPFFNIFSNISLTQFCRKKPNS